ncbi:Hypothetical cytosolic protein [Bifidobacterium animalis subsp. lactis CNCM I-2494]|uniref:Hypothetical cytosolic protein n=1 Tax=Bifidobacterium animalis subsp. lactis CNCM I-2494 TaxID=1042403 RepID=A0A806FJ00_BIFAN|nr:Hypothetical cytosolic protein [Bifidobacterium animalis subsp. lactis CNCM I-2494]
MRQSVFRPSQAGILQTLHTIRAALCCAALRGTPCGTSLRTVARFTEGSVESAVCRLLRGTSHGGFRKTDHQTTLPRHNVRRLPKTMPFRGPSPAYLTEASVKHATKASENGIVYGSIRESDRRSYQKQHGARKSP